MVLGVVLGFMVESNYRRALVLSGGDYRTFIQDPISAGLLALALLFIIGSLVRHCARIAACRRAHDVQKLGRMASTARAQRRRHCSAGARRDGAPAVLDVAGLCVAARHERLRRGDAGGGRSRRRVHGARPRRRLRCVRRGARQRHGGARRGLRRHVRRRPGAFGRGRRSGGAGRRASAKGSAATGCSSASSTGAELLCRLSLVAPKATHKAGFHPTAVFGAMAAAGAVGAALRLPAAAIASALGIAGSMASGIIEYLAEGTWTKRMHAGWAAQSGVRAALDGARRIPRAADGARRARTASIARSRRR